jgi:hypothetical protein
MGGLHIGGWVRCDGTYSDCQLSSPLVVRDMERLVLNVPLPATTQTFLFTQEMEAGFGVKFWAFKNARVVPPFTLFRANGFVF